MRQNSVFSLVGTSQQYLTNYLTVPAAIKLDLWSLEVLSKSETRKLYLPTKARRSDRYYRSGQGRTSSKIANSTKRGGITFVQFSTLRGE